jgi:hypothetical protein
MGIILSAERHEVSSDSLVGIIKKEIKPLLVAVLAADDYMLSVNTIICLINP